MLPQHIRPAIESTYYVYTLQLFESYDRLTAGKQIQGKRMTVRELMRKLELDVRQLSPMCVHMRLPLLFNAKIQHQ